MTQLEFEDYIQWLRKVAMKAIEEGELPEAEIVEQKLVQLAKRLLLLVDDDSADNGKIRKLLTDLNQEEYLDEKPWYDVRCYAYGWAVEKEYIPKLVCVKCERTDLPIMLWNFKTELCHTCDPDMNWLDSQEIECQQCKHKLIWELHSGFYDGCEYYCDSCFRRVEVSTSDPIASECHKLTQTDTGVDLGKYHSLVEGRLKECVCGGRYKCSSSRRCLYCSAVIPSEETNRNVYPVTEEELKIGKYIFCSELGDEIWK